MDIGLSSKKKKEENKTNKTSPYKNANHLITNNLENKLKGFLTDYSDKKNSPEKNNK